MAHEFKARAYHNPTGVGMRVKITKLPTGEDAELFNPSRFEVGEVRDVGPRMAEYLLACGYAEPYDGPEPDAIAADKPQRKGR